MLYYALTIVCLNVCLFLEFLLWLKFFFRFVDMMIRVIKLDDGSGFGVVKAQAICVLSQLAGISLP